MDCLWRLDSSRRAMKATLCGGRSIRCMGERPCGYDGRMLLPYGRLPEIATAPASLGDDGASR